MNDATNGHPAHHFIVKRKFADSGWYCFDGESLSMADACAALFEMFDDRRIDTDWDVPSEAVCLVLEIDGSVALNRTADAIAANVAEAQAAIDAGDSSEYSLGWIMLTKGDE